MSTGASANWKQLHGDAFRGQRVLITGGAGFIGSHLCEALVALGASVVVIDDMSGGSRENVEPFGVELIEASILDRDAVARATRGCKYVFHQAALGSVPRSVEQPRLYNDVNTTAFHALPGDDVPLREETLPIHDIKIRVRGYDVKNVAQQPEGNMLAPTRNEDALEVVVPRLEVHSVVVFELEKASP